MQQVVVAGLVQWAQMQLFLLRGILEALVV
jgi:hypothetical protein